MARGGDEILIVRFLSVLTLLVLASCTAVQTKNSYGIEFSQLPGWQEDRVGEVLPALKRSCAVLMKKPADAALGAYGKVGDWREVCEKLEQVGPGDAAARAYFEKNFIVQAVTGPEGPEGLFTGYYEPELRGSTKAHGKFQTPLYAKPKDLITADLGDFKPALKGQRITGRVVGEKLKPYEHRASIVGGSLRKRAKVLVWVDDPVDAFFLAIQGSGRVVMEDGSVLRAGYDGANGGAYVAIGKLLADLGAVERPVTMDKIRSWLAAHPDRAVALMNLNPSYVFFRALKEDGPVGAQGLVLTPRRSLAVDPSFIPLGMPLWLDTKDGFGGTFQHLMVAQDTGGAIKGAVRGDVFWGHGHEAASQAGAMQSRGRYYILLPR